MKKHLFIILTAAIATVFVFTACSQSIETVQPSASAQAAQTQSENESTISVSTTETVKVSPDIAIITMGVRTQAQGADEATKQNAQLVESFLAAVKGQGLTDDDIKTSYINMYADYEDPSQFIVENNYELTVRDIDKVGSVIDAAVAAGANTAYSLTFDVSDRDAQYIEALKLAMESVNEKAATVAQAGGYTIVRPLSIEEAGTSSYYDMPMAESQAATDTGGGTQVMPSDIEISATVTGRYIIE